MFRIIHTMGQVDFYEYQVSYTSDSDDGNFTVLAQGPNAREAGQDNLQITQ